MNTSSVSGADLGFRPSDTAYYNVYTTGACPPIASEYFARWTLGPNVMGWVVQVRCHPLSKWRRRRRANHLFFSTAVDAVGRYVLILQSVEADRGEEADRFRLFILPPPSRQQLALHGRLSTSGVSSGDGIRRRERHCCCSSWLSRVGKHGAFFSFLSSRSLLSLFLCSANTYLLFHCEAPSALLFRPSFPSCRLILFEFSSSFPVLLCMTMLTSHFYRDERSD
jgi:hypothetical protein